MYQSDVVPPIQMRQRTTDFSRVSTGDSDIPSSFEMKHEPEFKPLQGNPAFFWVRVSRGPFHLRQKTQGPSHVPIAEGKLHLRCWWKVGSSLQSKTGNQLSTWTIWGVWSFPRVAVLIWIFISTWDGCLRESLSIPQGSQATSTVCCGTRDSYAANQGGMGFILCWFRLQRAILHSWVEWIISPSLHSILIQLSLFYRWGNYSCKK